MSQFGDSAVAGAAIMGRISLVAFAAIFALSGAIGPIIGQNAGAGHYIRVRQLNAGAGGGLSIKRTTCTHKELT